MCPLRDLPLVRGGLHDADRLVGLVVRFGRKALADRLSETLRTVDDDGGLRDAVLHGHDGPGPEVVLDDFFLAGG